MDTVVTKHKDNTTYEEFIARVYSPVATSNLFCSATSTTNVVDSTICANQSNLAAALLDSHGHSHKSGHREQKFRGKHIFIVRLSTRDGIQILFLLSKPYMWMYLFADLQQTIVTPTQRLVRHCIGKSVTII